jgi:hypothetical protein
MTDLFVSAAAALMMILAITRPTPDIPLPIQADFIATCPGPAMIVTDSGDRPALSVTDADASTANAHVLVASPEDLWALPARFGMEPRLFYTIALTSGDEALTAACANWALNDLVRTANMNADTASNPGATNAPAIFGLELVTAPRGAQ